MVLVRHAAKKTFPKSLSSLTPSMQLKRYSMIKPTHIKSIWQPFLANFSNFLLHAKEILSNFGNALANSSGDFTDLLTKIQNHSIPSPVKIVNSGLHFLFSFFTVFYFFLLLFFFFSIFRTMRVRVYQSHCHISHKLMV